MSISDDERQKRELIDQFLKQINEAAETFGLGKNAFNEQDKELLKDTLDGNTELFEKARILHHDFVNQASYTIRYLTKGKPGGIENLQQLLIVYYRVRDGFLSSLLNIENEFYKYMVSQIVKVVSDNDADEKD